MRKLKQTIKRSMAALLALSVGILPCLTGFGPVYADSPNEKTYTVTIEVSKHGNVSFADTEEKTKAFKEGEEVSLAITPEEGYVLENFGVYAKEKAVAESKEGDNFTFTMPKSDLTVKAAFKKGEDELSKEDRFKLAKECGWEKFMDKETGYLKTEFFDEYDDTELETLDKDGAVSALANPEGYTYHPSFRSAKASSYISKYQYGTTDGYTTAYFEVVDGSTGYSGTAFCAQHSKLSPKEGTALTNGGLVQNDGIRRAVYYWDKGITQAQGKWSYGMNALVVSAYNGDDVLGPKGKALQSFLESQPAVPDDYEVYWMNTSSSAYQNLVYGMEAPIGYAQLLKTSADPSITNGNDCYSLEGAQYGIYTDYSCTNQVGTFTTDANGTSNTVELNTGTYYVKEIVAPQGYNKDTRVYTVNIDSRDTTTIKVSDIPASDPMTISIDKIDAEIGKEGEFLGTASLAGAEFTINYYDGYYEKDTLPSEPTRSWVIATKEIVNSDTGAKKYYCSLREDYKVSGDDFYYLAGNPDPTLPLGTVTVQETKAPEGYLLEDSYLKPSGSADKIEDIYVSHITMENGMGALVGGNKYEVSDYVIRGDIEFKKHDEETQTFMADIPFRITSKKTGETHTVMTDENGYFSSASNFIPHTQDTNGGTADSGLWFGQFDDDQMTKPNDELGALPYDTYVLEELRCENNQNKKLFKGTFTVERDKYVVDLGTIDNPDVLIETTAVDELTGTHYSMADDSVTILDTVQYTGLQKGKEYTLKGTVMVKETGEALLDKEGNAVTATKTFKPKKTHGEEVVEFNFDASMLAGKDVVIFEELFLDGTLVTEHKDIKDDDQTIYFPDLDSLAKDKETETNVSKADDKVTIIDKVTYSNLDAGKEYTLKGTLMDKASGKPVLDKEGREVTGKTTFKAQAASGTEKVEFTFDGSNLAGKTVVVFEELYRGEKLYAVHADMEDENQTVLIPKVKTKAKDKDTDTQNALADEMVTIVDTVSYENLIPGKEYTVKGILMDPETEKPVKAKVGIAQDREIPKDAAVTKVDAGTYAYVAEGTEDVPAGLYRETENGDYVTVLPDTAREEVADVYQLKEDMITWTDTFEEETEIYLKDTQMIALDPVSYELGKEEVEVTAETTFVPTQANGEVEVVFVFDGSALSGKTVVVFEDLFMDDKSVATHADLEDRDQSIYFPEIGTLATDKADGNKELAPTDNVTIVDTIQYKNLIPDKTYTAEGILMDKETGAALLIDGKEVTAKATFTAAKSSGTAAVEFTFSASKLEGKELVVFEKIYDEDGKEVAHHEDIEDKGQTVKVAKKPAPSKEKVQTGDLPKNILLGVGIGALVGAMIALFKKKKK